MSNQKSIKIFKFRLLNTTRNSNYTNFEHNYTNHLTITTIQQILIFHILFETINIIHFEIRPPDTPSSEIRPTRTSGTQTVHSSYSQPTHEQSTNAFTLKQTMLIVTPNANNDLWIFTYTFPSGANRILPRFSRN